MRLICAFSSDSRELYKADIYRVLALPEGHLVHFRYKTEYIADELLIDHSDQLYKDTAIFYTHGNPLDGRSSSIENTFVRMAKIVAFELSEDTKVIHIFMTLGKFCSLEIDSSNQATNLPPSKFLSELECTEPVSDHSWNDTISKIVSNFPEITFFRVKGIFLDSWCGFKEVRLNLSNGNRQCYYKLTQGKKYIMKIALGNPESIIGGINIHSTDDGIAINYPNPLITTAQFDDLDIPIIANMHSLPTKYSLLCFQPFEDGNLKMEEYFTNIELRLQLDYWKSGIFGAAVTVAAATALWVSSQSDFSELKQLIIPGFTFWFSTAFLFHLFNKK